MNADALTHLSIEMRTVIHRPKTDGHCESILSQFQVPQDLCEMLVKVIREYKISVPRSLRCWRVGDPLPDVPWDLWLRLSTQIGDLADGR